jgi:hypothetical protein
MIKKIITVRGMKISRTCIFSSDTGKMYFLNSPDDWFDRKIRFYQLVKVGNYWEIHRAVSL